MKAKRSIRRGASGSGAAAPAAKGTAKTKRKFAMPRRIPLTKSTLAFGSGVIIFSVGFVLQNFGTHPASSLQDAKRPDVQTAELPDTLVESADLSAITPTSAGVLPVDRPLPPLPRESVSVPATETEPGRGVTALAALQDDHCALQGVHRVHQLAFRRREPGLLISGTHDTTFFQTLSTISFFHPIYF